MSLPVECIDLAFADPPFNIGYDYDVYDDSRANHDYLDWSCSWIAAVHRVLKSSGTFWLAIGDEYAAELKIASQEIGFHCRSWVIWYYTFGVNCKYKFSRSHAHLFYFVKDAKQFTFRSEAPENRIPSARQLVYADTRAKPRRPASRRHLGAPSARPGRLLHVGRRHVVFSARRGHFQGAGRLPRLPNARAALGRIIRLCSNPGDIVLDPFSGSATTLAVAKKTRPPIRGIRSFEKTT